MTPPIDTIDMLGDRQVGEGFVGLPPSIPTRRELEEAQRREREMRPGAFTAVQDAIWSEWMVPWYIRGVRRGSGAWDLNWDPFDDSVRDMLLDGIDEDLIPYFTDTVSLEHALRVRDSLQGVMESRERLATLGWTGIGLRMGAAMLDPAVYAAAVATGGFSTGAHLTRMQRFVRGGLLAGGINVAVEYPLSFEDPDRGWREVLIAGTGGFLIGGGLNVLFGAVGARAASRDLKRLELNEIEAAMGAAARGELTPDIRQALHDKVLTPEGRKYFDEVLSPKAQREYVDSIIDRAGFDPVMDADIISQLKALDPWDAMHRFGQMQRPGTPETLPAISRMKVADLRAEAAEYGISTEGLLKPDLQRAVRDARQSQQAAAREARIRTAQQQPASDRPPGPPGLEKTARDLDLSGVSSAPAAWTPVRGGFSGRLGVKDLPDEVRKFANAAVDDALAKADGTPAQQAALGWVQRTRAVFTNRQWREHVQNARDFAREQGRKYTPEERVKFGEETARAIRTPGTPFASEALNRSVKLYRDMFAELLGFAQRHGVRGFENVQSNPQYFPRIPKAPAVRQMESAFGTEAMEDFFTRAIVAGTPDIEDDLARLIGRGLFRAYKSLDDISDTRKFLAITGDAEALADILRVHTSATDEQIARLLGREAGEVRLRVERAADPAAPATPRAMRRVRLDENFRDSEMNLTFADMLDNNVEVVFSRYVNDILGHSAMAELMRTMSIPDGPQFARFGHPSTPGRVGDPSTELRAYLEQQLRENARTNPRMTDRRIDRSMRRIDALHRAIMSWPQNADTTTSQVFRVMRGLSHLAGSGQFGVANMVDLGNTLGRAFVEMTFDQIPTFRHIWSRARTGQMTNELLENIETTVAAGTQTTRHQVVDRLDYSGSITHHSSSGFEQGLRRVQKTANYLSGMAHVNMLTQRSAAASVSQWMVNHAFRGREFNPRRLAQLGMSPEEGSRLRAAIVHEASKTDNPGVWWEPSMFGTRRRLRSFNIDAWDDQQIASRFLTAIDRATFAWAQEPGLGQIPMWMTKDWGQVIMQFRMYPATAWEKQVLGRLQTHTLGDLTSMAWGSLIAGVLYMGQQYALSFGRKDQKEFLEERLAWDSVVKASVQRAPWSSFLPDAIDTANVTAGGDPLFNFRNSDLRTGFVSLSQNPSTELVTGAQGAIGNVIGHTLRGQPMTESEIRRALMLLPFSRVFGLRNLLEAMATHWGEQP